MEDQKYCPLTGLNCKTYDCAWYIPPRWVADEAIPGKCAVLDIAKSVDSISREP